MPCLERPADGARRPLQPRTLVGRAAGAGLLLTDPRASSEHAVIYWRDGRWWVRDLASRNGTFVDGVRLELGERRHIAPGSRLGFGQVEGWRLAADGPPRAMAWRAGGPLRLAESGILVLPDDEAPSVSVYADDGWRIETADDDRPLDPAGEALDIDGARWTIRVPGGEERPRTTVDIHDREVTMSDVELRFGVSRDEEHVELEVRGPAGTVTLEPRAHLYVLLVLARLRLAELDASPAEAGWVDSERLADMLGVTQQKLNLDVFRARKQMAEAGVVDPARVVERRPQARTVRIGAERLVVESL